MDPQLQVSLKLSDVGPYNTTQVYFNNEKRNSRETALPLYWNNYLLQFYDKFVKISNLGSVACYQQMHENIDTVSTFIITVINLYNKSLRPSINVINLD